MIYEVTLFRTGFMKSSFEEALSTAKKAVLKANIQDEPILTFLSENKCPDGYTPDDFWYFTMETSDE